MNDMYICKLHSLPMRTVHGQDAYKCAAGCVITGIDIVTGKGKNAYWTTAKDLGNSGASYSANQPGILTPNPSYTGPRAVTWHYTTGSTTTNTGVVPNYPTMPNVTSEIKRLPVEKRDDPIHAWRYASSIKVVDGVVLFESVYSVTNGWYAADDRAVCNKNMMKHHWTQIPANDCTCGFYASKPGAILDGSCFDMRMEEGDRPDVLLEVELYGRVIEATAGYRAQHQKILAVYSDLDYSEIPGFNVRQTSEAYKKMRKEVEMKIRFSDGSKNIDIEMDEDNSFIYDGEGFTVGLGNIEETTEEDE